MNGPLRVAVLGFGLAFAIGGCGAHRGASPRGKAVVLITIDTLRADRTGAGGDPQARTPHLDRIARHGTQWARAVSPAPLTLPAHATILSGRTPPEHGARDNGLYRVPDNVPLVAESLRDAGWQTVAVLAAYPLAARFGLARGFDRYFDAPGLRTEGSGSSFVERPAHRVNEQVLSWLDTRGNDSRPLFLWVHYFDPHAPYVAPRVWVRSVRADPYRAEVAFTDDRVGRLCDRLFDAFADVRLVVTADHGESLGDHDEDTHGVFVYESTTRVPLIANGTGVPPGRLVGRAVSIDRIAPTLLALAGVDADANGFPGPSLLATRDSELPLYVESMYSRLRHGWAPLMGLRSERWKVIRAPHPEVYDLFSDPGERTNLFGSADLPDEPNDLLEALDARPLEIALPGDAPDPEVDEALRSLGYASARPGHDTGDGERPDPKDRVRLERLLGQAGGALEAGQVDAAGAALQAAVAIEPDNKETSILLARLEASRGSPEHALEILDRCLARRPASANALVHYTAGRIELETGRNSEAERRFAAAVRLDPLNVDARYNWGVAAYRQGNYASAAERWQGVLALDPGHPLAAQWLPDAQEQQWKETGK